MSDASTSTVDAALTTPPPAPAPPADVTPPGLRMLKGALEWVVIIIGALVAALLIKAFLVQAFFIPSASMEPSLRVGDRVLVNKLSYRFGDVDRGDIIVFKRPPNAPPDPANPNIKDLIKRVVGLPGDVLESRGGVMYVNGRALSERYLPPGTRTDGVVKQTVPEGRLFVMGDNRANSRDSRVFGPISQSLLDGRAFIRIWPLSKLKLL